MGKSVRDAYLETKDPCLTPLVRALDKDVMTAQPNLDSKVSQGMLTFGLDGDFHHWVCAIEATKSTVCLRFHFGTLLDDACGVHWLGSGKYLRSMRYSSAAEIDHAVVREYVSDAVSKLPSFKEAHASSVKAAWRERRQARRG